MNNQETKKQSNGLNFPDWKRVQISNEIETLAKVAVNAAFRVHSELGPGLLESAYEKCICHELRAQQIQFECQSAIPLNYHGEKIDAGFRLDLLLGKKLILELKAVDLLMPIHTAQVITYLRLLKLPLGLLINFNEPLIKHGIHRILNVPRSEQEILT
ncbi:MAG TPA: GxxExxY protein [Verrucomicrobiae bacterium]|jgi:GxxExxY protein